MSTGLTMKDRLNDPRANGNFVDWMVNAPRYMFSQLADAGPDHAHAGGTFLVERGQGYPQEK